MRAPLLFLICSLALPRTAHAESATEALRARDAEIRAALPPEGTEPTPAVRAKLEAIVTRAIDLRGMVERAMDRNWAKATPQQRRRILGAFERRFRALSGSQLDAYRATGLVYGQELAGANGLVSVPTQIDVKGEPTEITYTLRREKSGWRIQDIVIDGASTVEGFRSSFARTVAKEGIAGLVAKLERAAARKPAPGPDVTPKSPAGPSAR